MKSKYDEFYFGNYKNYPASTYWDLYDENNKKAIRKYDGHMFCPLCRLAPLTVAKGNERRYFKVIESDMDKHDDGCAYRFEKANKKETKAFYKDLDDKDIENRLVCCMNRMLKNTNKLGDVAYSGIGSKERNTNGFLILQHRTGRKNIYHIKVCTPKR